VRQALELEEVGKASSPEFFAAVDSLGEKAYYRLLSFRPRRDSYLGLVQFECAGAGCLTAR
jgi:hypothetical protein